MRHTLGFPMEYLVISQRLKGYLDMRVPMDYLNIQVVPMGYLVILGGPMGYLVILRGKMGYLVILGPMRYLVILGDNGVFRHTRGVPSGI